MKRRTIIALLVLATAASWWARRDDGASRADSPEASLAVGAAESLVVARSRESPDPASLDRSPEAPPAANAPASSTPLTRQRERLHDTAARLAARRDRARATGAPEATVQALDAHLARVEQRLAALGGTARGSIHDHATASRAAASPDSGS